MFKGAGTAYAGAILGLLLIASTGKPQQNEVSKSSSEKTPSEAPTKTSETRQMKSVQEKPVAMDKIVLPPPPIASPELKSSKKIQRQVKTSKLNALQRPAMPTSSAVIQEIEPLKIKPMPSTVAHSHRTIQPLKKIAPKPVAKNGSASVKHNALNNLELTDYRKRRVAQESSKEERVVSNIVEPNENGAVERRDINGRALVRMLEHGSGPNIRLAWPDGRRNREDLFQMLTTCFGMKTGVMDSNGSVFNEGTAPGTPWPIDLDKYSGFLRHADGVLAPSEAKLVYRIVGRHRLAPQSKVVRIFPRAFDASLLAGISRIASRNLKEGSNVRARYEMTGGGVNVSQVVVNEKSMPGKIKFFTHTKSCSMSG